MTNAIEINVWVGSLNAYNEGKLIGEWLSLPMDNTELRNAIGAIQHEGRGEEVEIFDTDITHKFVREAVEGLHDVYAVNAIAEEIESWDGHQIDDAEAIYEAHGIGFEELCSVIANDEYMILNEVDSEYDLGYEYVFEGLFGFEIPSEMESYFDYESLGRDLTHDGWVIDHTSKMAVLLTN